MPWLSSAWDAELACDALTGKPCIERDCNAVAQQLGALKQLEVVLGCAAAPAPGNQVGAAIHTLCCALPHLALQ